MCNYPSLAQCLHSRRKERRQLHPCRRGHAALQQQANEQCMQCTGVLVQARSSLKGQHQLVKPSCLAAWLAVGPQGGPYPSGVLPRVVVANCLEEKSTCGPTAQVCRHGGSGCCNRRALCHMGQLLPAHFCTRQQVCLPNGLRHPAAAGGAGLVSPRQSACTAVPRG